MPNTGSGTGRSLRQLAAAPLSDDSYLAGSSARSMASIPRRKLVKNACRNCQTKKTRCDGRRPRCTRCDRKFLECKYDTLYEGMTRQQSAEYEISRLQDVISTMNRKFRVLKHGTLDEAQALLTSIRLGTQAESVEDESLQPDTLESLTSSTPTRTFGEEYLGRHFLPLLFNRHDWKREPSPIPGEDNPGALSSAEPGVGTNTNSQQLCVGDELVSHESNGFGNLPFSSGILANHHPPYIQQQQLDNLFRPLWSIMPLTTLPGASSVKESVAGTLRQARSLIQSGQYADRVTGSKCNIAAIFDQDQFDRAPLLTQWAARFIFSMQHKHRHFVAFASMHLVWTLTRWMIDPQPDTYEAVPEWFRPTMLQLWIPHVEVLDYVLWPGLRDKIVVYPHTLQRDWRWLEDITQTIECDWFVDLDLALEVDASNGETYLTDAAKMCAELPQNWSVGSSAGQYIESIDSIMRIRPNFQHFFG